MRLTRYTTLGAALLATACGNLTNSGDLPAGTANPSVYYNATGAIGMRNAAVHQLDAVLADYIVNSGLLTDELQDNQTGAGQGALLQSNAIQNPLDERILVQWSNDQSNGQSYNNLQTVRAQANVALAALAKYDTAAADTAQQHLYRGELYAYEAYAEILLSDLYCSGVPLSTLDFLGDFTYKPSSTTAQVYQDALDKLDSALTLAAASDSVVNLAHVLQGRAYLALGQYDAAATAVAAVPNAFKYRMTINFPTVNNLAGGVADQEGGNGLPFRTSADPRIVLTKVCAAGSKTYCPNADMWFPSQYPIGATIAAYANFVVASGVEAQLIQAEAQLQPATAPSGPWLTTLNTLRESIGLSDTTDPGTPEGRLSLLFRERAYWLFLTGHRQGDLRRQLRQYPQYWPDESDVYPTGVYTAPGTGLYGTDVTVPIPVAETANPAFHGCLNRNP